MEWRHALVVTLIVQACFLIGLLLQIATIRILDVIRDRRMAPLLSRFERTLRLWSLGEAPVQDVVLALRPLGRARAIRALSQASSRTEGKDWRALGDALAGESWVRGTRRSLSSRRWWKRRECARLLSVTATPEDVRAVVRLLRDPHPAVSIAIVPALERLQGPELTAAVIERLPHLTPVVLAYHAWTLRRSGAPVAASIIGLLRDADGPMTVRLAEFGAHLADPALRPSFIALAGHANPEVRARAARGLATMSNDQVVEVLERLARDDAWQVRLQAVKSLGRIAAPSCLGVLRAALADPVHWVRLRAGGALARLGDPGRQALAVASAGEDAGARDVARLMLSLPGWSLEDVTA